MGFYDSRCMVTGISLWAQEAVLVLLDPSEDGTHRPISLGVRGSSNRFGSIDFIKASPNVSQLAAFLRKKFESGELDGLEERYQPKLKDAGEDLERFFQAFERNMNEGDSNTLAGRRLAFALVSVPVWDGLVERASIEEPAEILFPRLFGESATAREIYRDLSSVRGPIEAQYAVHQYLESRGMEWTPSPSVGDQHFSEEVLGYLAAARQRFADSTLMLEILSEYAEDIELELEDR
jgi:hypothetical protein